MAEDRAPITASYPESLSAEPPAGGTSMGRGVLAAVGSMGRGVLAAVGLRRGRRSDKVP